MPIVDETKATGEQRISRLIEAYAPGVWDWDAASDQFLATQRLRNIFGLGDAETVTLRTLLALTHPDDRDWASIFDAPPEHFGAQPKFVRFRIVKASTGEVRWIASRNLAIRRQPMPKPPDIQEPSRTLPSKSRPRRHSRKAKNDSRLAIEAGKMAVWEVDLETGKMTPSPELNVLCGFDPDAEPNLQDVRALYNPGEIERLAKEGATVEVVRQRAVGGAFEPWSKGAFKSGADRTQVQAEVAITTPAGVPKRLLLRAQYALSTEGRPLLTGLLVDITESKMAEERLAVVARELQHRVKNSLSVIRAIAVQSLRGKTDAEAALESFLGRISALAAATDLILEKTASKAELGGVIEKITRPYRDKASDPFVLEGPPVILPANVATAMGMVLHELCTNAVKYGALSVAAGEVLIHWRLETNWLALTWQERNGPSVIAPSRRGFGSRLLENILAGEVGGKAEIAFAPQGVRCEIVVPT